MPCDVICDVTDATIASKPVVVMIESLSAEEEARGDAATLGPMLDQAGIGLLPYAVDSRGELLGLLGGLRDALRKTPIPLFQRPEACLSRKRAFMMLPL